MTGCLDIRCGTIGRMTRRPAPRRASPASGEAELRALDESRKLLDEAIERYDTQLAIHKRNALAAVRANVPKTKVAQHAGYTTKQLDRWIAEAEQAG